jgi:hypothetical protein
MIGGFNPGRKPEVQPMTETDFARKTDLARKLDQLDYLLNDPDAPIRPGQVWALLAEISRHEAAAADGGRDTATH